MLLLVLTFTSTSRTLFVANPGELTSEVWLLTAFTVLPVSFAIYAGSRFPPPFLPVTMRRIAFATLLLIGLSLMFNAID